MSDSIWTRQRRLREEESDLLKSLRRNFKSLSVELDHDDWASAAASSDEITSVCVRMTALTIELDDVDWIVGSFDRINERMEALEQMLVDEGLGI